MNDSRHRQLVEGLVGQHQRQYLTDAHFRQFVDTLAHTLTALVDLAATDVALDRGRERLARLAAEVRFPAEVIGTPDQVRRGEVTRSPLRDMDDARERALLRGDPYVTLGDRQAGADIPDEGQRP